MIILLIRHYTLLLTSYFCSFALFSTTILQTEVLQVTLLFSLSLYSQLIIQTYSPSSLTIYLMNGLSSQLFYKNTISMAVLIKCKVVSSMFKQLQLFCPFVLPSSGAIKKTATIPEVPVNSMRYPVRSKTLKNSVSTGNKETIRLFRKFKRIN